MLAALNFVRSARLDELVSGRADAASGWSKVRHGCVSGLHAKSKGIWHI